MREWNGLDLTPFLAWRLLSFTRGKYVRLKGVFTCLFFRPFSWVPGLLVIVIVILIVIVIVIIVITISVIMFQFLWLLALSI